ncbi:TlpA family protein disulfide reductase [bacterium]|nr:TlpA family protein disulfide reductase [bacterium]
MRRALLISIAILFGAATLFAQVRTGAMKQMLSLDPVPGSVKPTSLPPDGRPWIVFIFKACCAPADQAAGWVVDAEQRYGDRVGIVGLNVDRTRTIQKVPGWLHNRNVSFPVLWDATGQVSTQSWGVVAPPTVVLLDSTGAEVYRTMGYIPAYNDKLTAKLESLLSDETQGETP